MVDKIDNFRWKFLRLIFFTKLFSLCGLFNLPYSKLDPTWTNDFGNLFLKILARSELKYVIIANSEPKCKPISVRSDWTLKL